jgi:hypothetical protein
VGHNHGTKFRISPQLLPSLYATVDTVVDQPLDYSERLKHIDLTTIHSTEEIEEAASTGPVSIQTSFLSDKE